MKCWSIENQSVELLKNCESKCSIVEELRIQVLNCWRIEELNFGIDAWKNVGVEELRQWIIEALKNKSAEELKCRRTIALEN